MDKMLYFPKVIYLFESQLTDPVQPTISLLH